MGATGGSSGGLAGIFLHLGSVSTPAKSKTQTSGQHCYQNGSLFVYSETQKSWRESTIIRIYPIIRSLFLDQSRHWTGNVEDALSTSKSTVHFYVRTPLRPQKKNKHRDPGGRWSSLACAKIPRQNPRNPHEVIFNTAVPISPAPAFV